MPKKAKNKKIRTSKNGNEYWPSTSKSLERKRKKRGGKFVPISFDEKKKVVDLMMLGVRFATASRTVGRTYRGMKNCRENDPKFDEACTAAEAVFYDMLGAEAESSLMRKVREGSMPAITYVLNNRMKETWEDKPQRGEMEDTLEQLKTFLASNEENRNG